jgi:hypothetical protein
VLDSVLDQVLMSVLMPVLMPQVKGMGIIAVASPTLTQRTPTMAFSIESTVGDLLDNPGPRAVLDKIMPQLATNPQIDMARGMSLKMVAGFSGGKITDALLAEVDAALAKL